MGVNEWTRTGTVLMIPRIGVIATASSPQPSPPSAVAKPMADKEEERQKSALRQFGGGMRVQRTGGSLPIGWFDGREVFFNARRNQYGGKKYA
jgi:hypothetical protein